MRDWAAVNKPQYEKIMEGNKAFDVCKMETSVFIISIVFPGAVPLILQLTANTPQSIKAFKFSYDAILLKMKIKLIFLNFNIYLFFIKITD